MADVVVKIIDPVFKKEYYMVWSTIVDAPKTYGLSKEEITEYYLEECGKEFMPTLGNMLERAERNGTSSRFGETLSLLIHLYNSNVLKPGDDPMTFESLLENYCRNRKE